MFWLFEMIGRAFFLSLLFVLPVACTTAKQPLPNSFSNTVTLFTYSGFEFAALIEGGELLVKVPCCQTYEADDAFKALMLEAIGQRLGCVPADPEFTYGWIGAWQLRTPFACFDGGQRDPIMIADDSLMHKIAG
ncbi:MAG: hypothetical protein AAGK23_05045 [Pseudomonadota bacterium]